MLIWSLLNSFQIFNFNFIIMISMFYSSYFIVCMIILFSLRLKCLNMISDYLIYLHVYIIPMRNRNRMQDYSLLSPFFQFLVLLLFIKNRTEAHAFMILLVKVLFISPVTAVYLNVKHTQSGDRSKVLLSFFHVKM